MTQHNGVCGACATLLVPMTAGWVSARLWRDSGGEREKDREGGKSAEQRRQGQKIRNDKEKREVCEEKRRMNSHGLAL